MAIKDRSGTRSGVRYTIVGPQLIEVPAFRQVLLTSVSDSPGQDHPFESVGYSGQGAFQHGKLGAVNDFNGSPSGLYYTLMGGGNSLNGPAVNANSILARTNPARPSVLLPVFWFELKDLPDMLRQAGRFARYLYFNRGNVLSLIRPGSIASDTALLNIVIQFGWRPFVSDLWKIVTFQDAVEKRRKELAKLSSGKGLSKVVHFGTETVTEAVASVVAQSDFGAFATTSATLTHTCEVWGSARWVPTPGQTKLPPSDGALRRQLTGLTPDAILLNVWEALPWSWLADWFAPIGDIIGGANRTIATPVSVCIMRRRTTIAQSAPKMIVQDPLKPYMLDAGTFEWHQHQRATSAGFADTASYPTLGANQLSILGSLAILRAHR